jgi:hypothetical protein
MKLMVHQLIKLVVNQLRSQFQQLCMAFCHHPSVISKTNIWKVCFPAEAQAAGAAAKSSEVPSNVSFQSHGVPQMIQVMDDHDLVLNPP